ncbi:MAG: 23S rRNA (adenine(2503)-C(2))-methyltransferase RlmN [Ignavibacteriae bacterium]|nr:23S rRNA (adenine(2503)-C(2))-methyltransferase RlmN [Ignavibacteriota bacterium]
MKLNLLNLTLSELTGYLVEAKEQKFRARQIFDSIHSKGVTEIGDIIGIPGSLKAKMNEEFEIPALKLDKISESELYNTKKFLFELPGATSSKVTGNLKIETVLINEGRRHTVCVSTQVGCNVGCEFCATGKMGFQKNLDVSQIINQVYGVIKCTGTIPTNLVFMGMGEPFLNYDNMLNALQILTSEFGLQIPSRKITISTVGFKGKIKKFADDITLPENTSIKNVKLALSLHSTDNGIREAIIPTSVKNRLPDLYEELVYFYKKTGNKVTYEYIYFDGLNDTENDIKRLEKLSRMIPCNINIIPFHPIDFELGGPLSRYNAPNDGSKVKTNSLLIEKINDFIAELRARDVVVNLRSSSGVDINAACGQLAVTENKVSSL